MILITGASGLLGSALIKELYDKGCRKLRVLLHSSRDYISLIKDEGLDDLDLEIFEGDVQDKESLIDAMKGVTELYHLAALISIVPGMYDELYKINVNGVINIVELAIEYKVKKMVHVASVEAIGYKDGERGIDESYGFRPDDHFIEYGKTKALAALKALELARNANLDLTILAPGGILGPYDYRVSRIGKMIWDVSRKKLPAYIDGSFDFVDSRDVASLCYTVMEKGKPFETYICAGNPVSLEEIVKEAAKQTSVKTPLKVNIFIAKIMAFFFELGYKIFGGQPLITSGSLAMTQVGVTYSSKKANKEFGWTPRPIKESVADTYQWYKKHNAK